MRWLLFLSRLAFICNVFFLLTVVLHFRKFVDDRVTISTIIIIGYVLAALFNPLVNLIYLTLILTRKKLLNIVPRWIILSNFIFLLLQLQFILFLNDTQHP